MHKWLVSRRNSTARAMQLGSVAATVLLTSLAASSQVSASEPAKRRVNETQITPFVGYMAGGEFEDPGIAGSIGSDRDVKEDTDYGVIFNFNAEGPERQYEVFYAKQASEIEGATPLDLDIQYLQIGGIVNFTDNPRVIPFFGITAGAARFTPDAPGLSTETKIAFSIGGGLKVPITDHIGIRLDTRAFVTLLDSDSDIFCASSDGAGACGIRAKSDTFLQYAGSLGLVIGF